jgi:autotransporter-associated beta strand protein
VLAACFAAIVPGSAWAQRATWVTTNASGTNFNAGSNWSGSPTFGTTGTFTFMGGTSAAMPVLTQSTTIARLTTGTTAGATTSGTISLSSSDAANVLTLSGTGTGANGAIAVTSTVSLNVSANVSLGGGNQTFYTTNNTFLTIGGAISGGSAANTLTLDAGAQSASRRIVLNGTSSFLSRPVVSTGLINVASFGSTGGVDSSLGRSGTVQFGNASFVTVTGANQTTDKTLLISGTGGFGDRTNSIGSGFTNMTFTGPITNVTGSNAGAVLLGSGTISGLISQAASGTLSLFAGGGLTISNTANDFAGVPSVIRNSVLTVPMFGNASNPSPLGRSGTINLSSDAGFSNDSGVTLRFSGASESSDKTFNLNFTTGEATLDTGTGTLVLTNTAAWTTTGAASKTVILAGRGKGSLAASLTNTTTGTGGANALTKSGTGSWTLSGANTYTGTTAIQAGTLTFAKRTSLYAGGTANWTQALINTTASGSTTLGLGVGGVDGFTNDDVTTLLTNLGTGAVSTGGMRATSSWGFDTTNTGSTFTITNAIGDTTTGGGAIGVVKLGSGTLALGGNNTFSYGTRVDGGTLLLTHTNALGAGTAFVLINGGTLDLGGLTVNRGGPITATAGTFVNGVLTGTAGLTKTGTGTLTISSGSNTFTGATSIQEGVVEVATLANAGSLSPLGSPTTNASIGLGGAATSGTLRYIGGADSSTNRSFGLGSNAGGGIDGSGVGALTVTGTVTGGTGVKIFTLSGTSTAPNTIGTITGTGVSVVKDGTGLWRMNAASKGFGGTLTVKNGTLQVANAGAVGSTVAIGDTAAGASGVAALLLEQGVNATSSYNVSASAGTQAVLIGGANTSGTASFGTGEIRMSRGVTLVASTGGVVDFSTTWAGATPGSSADQNVTIGAAGYAGRVLLNNSGTLGTTGTVAVAYGTAVLGLDTRVTSAGTLTTASGATLAGTGFVTNAIGGAGFVSPGNSPGILTAGSLDPSAGTDFIFEITGTAPDFTERSASINDVLRLTDGTSPFASALGAGNVVNVLFSLSGTAPVDFGTYKAGFFTDLNTNFSASISSGSFAYWVLGAYGTGGDQQQFAVGTDGAMVTYSRLGAFSPSLSVQTSVVPQTAGAVNGQITQFTVVVPEPATLLLAGVGTALVAWRIVRRRRAG